MSLSFWLILCICFTANTLELPHLAVQDNGDKIPPFGDYPAVMRHANHLFNTLHSSMRQFGSAWFHNGMSFFIATVPADTQLYHGTHTSKPVSGMEWLAFEAEHALGFGRTFSFVSPLSNGTENVSYNSDEASHTSSLPSREDLPQKMLTQSLSDPPINLTGFLHTYRTKHELRLLYLDGLSAGKSNVGTLDTQDFILTDGGHRFPFQDTMRARELCARARDDWDNRIDGFLRTEVGNEIILCNFSSHLNFVSALQQPPWNISDTVSRVRDQYGWFKSAATRYNGIGGNRVKLNYKTFVSVYTHLVDLFGDGPHPRLMRATMPQIKAVRSEVDDMIMQSDSKSSDTDWQAIVDMIVARYAAPLQYLLTSAFSDPDIFYDEVERLMSPFMDASDRNYFAERQRCVDQFLPGAEMWNASLAGRVTQSISLRVCSYMLNAMILPHGVAVFNLKTLVEWLDWTVWRQCLPGCQMDEVCVIPIWPWGSIQDRRQPTCKNVTAFTEDGAGWYWGDEWTGTLPPGIPLTPTPRRDDGYDL